jgi:hypothetical protein
MERTKSPGHRIHVEDVRHTLAKRADGGRVQGLQTGGIPAMPYGASPMSGLGPMPYAGGASYVPQVGPINIPKLPVAAPMAAPQDDSSKMFMDALKISKLGTDNADKNADAMQDFRMDTLGMSEASGGRVPRAYGGLAMPSSNRINVPMRGGFGMPSFMARGGLAEGGTPDDDIATAALDAAPELAASSPPIVSDVAPPVGVQVAQAAPPSGVAMDALPPEITAGASKSSAVDRLKAGIAQSETGGQRDPYGSVTSTGTGHKVYGKYQVYDDNIPIWTKQATGQAMTPAQYLASPEAQEAVASHKLGEYANKYGYAGAARAWLAGEGGMNNPNARDKFGSDPYGYSAKVMARAGLGDDAGGTQALAFDGAPAPQRGIGIATTDAGGIPGVTPIKAADLAEKTKPNKDDIWMSLLAAGLGMMGSRSPYAGVGIGQGGLQGLQTYEALHKQRVGEAEHQATLDFQAAHANQAPQMQERQFAQQKELERLRESQQTGQQGRLFEQQLQEKGYRRTPNGLEAIPGGPADPAVIEKQSIAKLSGGLMDDETAEVSARRDIKGDTSWSKNIGRGAQAGHNIVKVNEMETKILRDEYGYSPQQAAEYIANQRQAYHAEGIGMGAGARTEATREAQLGIILRATDAAIPAALEQSEKVSRTGWVPLNQIIQKGQVIASNPDLKAFGMANLQLAEHWARAMNPTGVMRETDRDKALSFLSTADSKETYKRAVGQLRTQIEREKTAVHAQKEPVPGGAAPSEAGGTSTAASAGPVKVQTPAEAAKLEPGTHYITPDGKEYTR